MRRSGSRLGSSHAVWLAGIAAILPIAAIGTAQAQAPAPAGAFAPPVTPLLLTRTLRHLLQDGKAVVTRRTYRVHFAPEHGGFVLDGTLTDVAVEAPPGLEALATLERRRPDAGMFPMRLDSRGRILPAADLAPSAAQRQAIGVASAQIARMDLTTSDAAQAQGFVAQLQAQPYRTAWPQDLFYPAPGARREQRTIPLPDGQHGLATTEAQASADPESGLLSDFTRKVTTDLAGDTRVVIEEWTLVSAP